MASHRTVSSLELDEDMTNAVLAATGAKTVASTEVIQSLWSGYGEIVRLTLEGSIYPSVILKHIKLPQEGAHPRGWNTDLSHRRKVYSYQVEAHWYQNYAKRCGSDCPVPNCLAVQAAENETLLLLTDLDAEGFDVRKETVELEDIYACLEWLANFHSQFLNSPADDLWECGTYWHLDTRPDELAALEDNALKQAAHLIDQRLRQSQYQTLVHGDAKLANFCFTANAPRPGVAAVDFQYVGRGCGMKDVAYFVGSCLYEEECEALQDTLLDFYFTALRQSLRARQPGIDPIEVEQEWRELYAYAWADFHRFLKGWSPGHWKINSYSESLTRSVVERLQQ